MYNAMYPSAVFMPMYPYNPLPPEQDPYYHTYNSEAYIYHGPAMTVPHNYEDPAAPSRCGRDPFSEHNAPVSPPAKENIPRMQESFRYNPSAPVFVPSQQNSNAASPTTTSADQSTHAPATDVSHIEDFFDNVLHLEDNMYSSGYAQGVQDGSRAGRIEGRVFGLEKGFEKFASLGRLHGRAAVWGSRMYDQSVAPVISSPDADPNLHSHYPASDPASANAAAFNNNPWALPPLPSNDRLNRNIHLVYHMTDPHTFDTANTEEAVADFDDRFKRAGAKAKIIERSVGADRETKKGNRKGKGPNKKGKKMRLVGENKGKEDSMEDFKGGKMLS